MDLKDYVPPTPEHLNNTHIWLWCGAGYSEGKRASGTRRTTEQYATFHANYAGDDIQDGKPDVIMLIVAEVDGLVKLPGTTSLEHSLFNLSVDSRVIIGSHEVVSVFDLGQVPSAPYREGGPCFANNSIWYPIAEQLQDGNFARIENESIVTRPTRKEWGTIDTNNCAGRC